MIERPAQRGKMAEQQLPTEEERRQEVEQRSAAKLTDEVERVREHISKQLAANISAKQREEEKKRAAQQQERLKQIEAASARAVEARKADEEKAYLAWLSEQKLDVKNGIPNRPMFKEEFEKHWQKSNLAIPAWDLGIFGTAPQAQPAPKYKRREDGSWRWEERDYAACVYEQVHRPLLKSNSRKLSSLPPVEPVAAPDPANELVRLAAEVAEAASKEATAASAGAKQQRRKDAGRKAKKVSSQHAGSSRTPGTHKSYKHAHLAAADEGAAAVAGNAKPAAGKLSAAAGDKAAGAAGAEAYSNAVDPTVAARLAAVRVEAVSAHVEVASAAKPDNKQMQNTKKAADAGALGTLQQASSKGGNTEFSVRMSDALHMATKKLQKLGSFGSLIKHRGNINSSS